MMSGHHADPIFNNKKMKIGRPENSLTSTPLRPITSHFCQKRCLRIVLDDYDSVYDVLLRKSRKVTMKIKRLRALVIENFKTVNNLNPNYMKDIFTPKLHLKVRQMTSWSNIIIPLHTMPKA